MRKIPKHLRLAFLHFIVDTIEEAEARRNGNGRPWSDADKRKLIELRNSGVGGEEIARGLRRTKWAARKQYDALTKEAV